MPLDPQEACVYGARLRNQSAFILDPRLLKQKENARQYLLLGALVIRVV